MIASQRKRRTRHIDKPKLLFDENFTFREKLRGINRYCNVRHVSSDFKLFSLKDNQVYEIACQQRRMLITFNGRHFRSLLQKTTVSIIGVSMKLTNDQVDKKLISLVKNIKPIDYTGKYYYLSSETKRTK